jgi:hypothetical protein
MNNDTQSENIENNPSDDKREESLVFYTLPLSPQDLVAIYKEKEKNKNFILYVDYEKTKEKLSAKHIIIYLANTNFKAGFTYIDGELIAEYIRSDFMVDSPILVRMLAIIVRMRLHYEINDAERQLLFLFPEDNIHGFIEENIDLVDELIETISQAVPFALTSLYENLSDVAKKDEVELTNYVNSIEVVDKPSNCGPNVARFMTEGWDGFLCVIHNMGVANKFNKAVYNSQPKYFGKDLYFIMNETRVIDQIMGLFPSWFWNKIETINMTKILEEEAEKLSNDSSS